MSGSRTTDAGSFELPAALHLKNVTRTAIHTAVQPDAFDHEGSWYRLLRVGTGNVSLRAMPSGILAWLSSDSVNIVDVQRQVERIFSLVPLPGKRP